MLNRIFDIGTDSIHSHGHQEAFMNSFRDRRHLHRILLLELFESIEISLGLLADTLPHSATPALRNSLAPTSNQSFVRPDHWLQMPGHTIVPYSKPKEIQQHVQQFSAIRLGRCAVVVAILSIIFDDGFKHQRQPTAGVVKADDIIDVVEQLELIIPRLLLKLLKPGMSTLMQNRTQVAKIEKPLSEEIAPVSFYKIYELIPRVSIPHLFQHGKPKRLAVFQPSDQRPFGESFNRQKKTSLPRTVFISDILTQQFPKITLLAPSWSPLRDRLNHRTITDFEELIELRDRPLPHRMCLLHFSGQFKEMMCRFDQAKTRQRDQQLLDCHPSNSRADDLVGIPALRQRNIKQRLLNQLITEFLKLLLHCIPIMTHCGRKNLDVTDLVGAEAIHLSFWT